MPNHLFEKAMDPKSVVREGEAMRPAAMSAMREKAMDPKSVVREGEAKRPASFSKARALRGGKR